MLRLFFLLYYKKNVWNLLFYIIYKDDTPIIDKLYILKILETSATMCEKHKIMNNTLVSIISPKVVTKSWFKHVIKYLIKQQDADHAR